MEHWFGNLLYQCSTLRFGWHHRALVVSADQDMMAVMFFVVYGIILVVNIFYFAFNYSEYKSKIYLPLAILYLIINTIFHFILACIFISIGGPVGLAIMGVLYFIVLMIVSIDETFTKDVCSGWFNLLVFMLKYSQRYATVKQYEKQLQLKYESFLQMKYL